MSHQTIAGPKRYKCRHLFLDGHRCGSPSLRGEEFCYYHHTTRGAVADLRDRRARMCEFELPPLEDRSSLLAALAEVLQRLAACAIDNKRAGLLLYGLQIASRHLPQPVDAEHNQTVEEVIPDPRFGNLAPIAEITEPTATVEALEIEALEIEAPPTNPGAPCPASGTWVSTPPTQPEAEPKSNPEPAILPNLQATAAPRTERQRRVSYQPGAQAQEPIITEPRAETPIPLHRTYTTEIHTQARINTASKLLSY